MNPEVSVEQAAALVPGRNGHVQPNTIRRWITHGHRGVKLPAWRVGKACGIRGA